MSNLCCALGMHNGNDVKARLSINSEIPQVVIGAAADFSLFALVDSRPGFAILLAEPRLDLHKNERVSCLSNQVNFVS